MVFFLALLPTVINLQTLTLPAFVELAAAIAVILPTVLGSYALLASRARRFFRSERRIKALNRSTSAVMASAAVIVVSK
jgi:threonine/homoserine/homoserine lactone efflux protein